MGNNYNVPIQGSYSESTRTKLTPDVKFTSNELLQIINSQTSAKAIADKEAADKATRLSKSNSAYQKRIKTGIQSSQELADETGAIGDKISLQNLPYIGKYIPNILDVTGGIGSMASGLGRVPLNLEQRNYKQAALSVITPLTVGALAGIGNPNTGQFVNNIVNPLAGTGDLINNLGNKYLPNAHKLNPKAFKPNSEMGYRMLGKEGFEDAVKSGVLRAKPVPNQITDGISLARNTNRNPNTGKMQGALDRPYFADGVIDERYASNYMVAVNKTENNLIPIPTHKGIAPASSTNIPIENAQFYKKDWLKGYKEIKVPKGKTSFKSEIDWSKWNKEIPENKALMQEYSVIEQQAKANGTWMKNSDGSVFNGTPEQFVQQNSENFKKAFGNTKVRDSKGNIQITNHSTNAKFDEFDLSKFGSATDEGFYGKGVYFHPKTNNVALYGDRNINSYLNIENPAPEELIPFFGREGKGRFWNKDYTQNTKVDDIKSLWKDKYDGVITNHAEKYNDFNSTEYVTHPLNIKSAVGNNGMFDMTNPNIYKSVVGALATGTLGKQAMEKKELGGYVRTSKSGRKFTYPSFEGQKQEIINRILTK